MNLIDKQQKSASNKILNCILELQKANRNISEHDLARNIVIILLAQYEELSLGELMHYLNSPQAFLTHLLKRMENKKLINVRQEPSDLRFRFYRLSKTGQMQALLLDKHYDTVLKERENNFLRSDSRKLSDYFKILCDAANIKSQRKRPNEHIIRHQQRRLAALIGVTGRKILSLKISSSDFHVFRLLYLYNGLLTVKNISDELFIKSSQVSSILKKFIALKLITQQANPEDERSNLLKLTSKGILHFESEYQLLLNKIELYLAVFSESEQVKFAELFTSFTRSEDLIELVPQNINSQQRPKIIELAYLRKALDEIPDIVAGDDNLIFKLTLNGHICAYAQINSSRGELDLLVWQPGIPLFKVKLLLEAALKVHPASLNLNTKLLKLFAN